MKRKSPVVALALGAVLATIATDAFAQAVDADGNAPRTLQCPRPAEPRNRHFLCRQTSFDMVEETLTGDWNEARSDLAKAGITPTASWAGAYYGAASGPATKPSFVQQLVGSVSVALDKAVGAPKGLSFYVGGTWAQEVNAASWLNSNPFGVSGLAVGSSGWLTEVYLQQTLLAGNLTLAGGWMSPASTFSTLPIVANYANAAFTGSPVAPTVNDPPFGGPPTNAQWGVQAIWNATPAWQLAAGLFNNNPNAATGANHGTNFALRQGNTGALAVAQATYLAEQGSKAKGPPGQYTFGVIHDGNRFADLATGELRAGNWHYFALGQQQVTGSTGGSGVTLWGGVTWAPSQAINRLPAMAGAGASWKGPFASRPKDIASAAYYYGNISNTQPGATQTQAVEVNYQYALTGAVTLMPDFQYLWRLDGLPSPGAAVFMLQANVAL